MATFLHEQAIEKEKKNNGKTYLFMQVDEDSRAHLVAYFTVTLKNYNIPKELTRGKRKKLTGGESDKEQISGYLIGQLGKNDSYRQLMKGTEILNTAESIIGIAATLTGGRFIIVEYEDIPLLNKFYESHKYTFYPPSEESEGELNLYMKRIPVLSEDQTAKLYSLLI